MSEPTGLKYLIVAIIKYNKSSSTRRRRKFSEEEYFWRSKSYTIILVLNKPTGSFSADGVKLCHNFAKVKLHFDALLKSQLTSDGEVLAVLC